MKYLYTIPILIITAIAGYLAYDLLELRIESRKAEQEFRNKCNEIEYLIVNDNTMITDIYTQLETKEQELKSPIVEQISALMKIGKLSNLYGYNIRDDDDLLDFEMYTNDDIVPIKTTENIPLCIAYSLHLDVVDLEKALDVIDKQIPIIYIMDIKDTNIKITFGTNSNKGI